MSGRPSESPLPPSSMRCQPGASGGTTRLPRIFQAAEEPRGAERVLGCPQDPQGLKEEDPW